MPNDMEIVGAVRKFNRFYTKQIGLVREGLLDTRFSLTQARVLYEIAHHKGITAVHLAECLNLDAGYLSRLITTFQKDGLITRKASGSDGRVQHLRLSSRGRSAFATLDRRSAAEAGAKLQDLTPDSKAKLIEAMNRIEALLDTPAKQQAIQLRAHQPGDIGWVISRHAEIYAREYGWDGTFEGMVAEIAAKFIRNFDAQRERCWIAETRGQRVGCVFLVKATVQTAKLRMLLVEPEARGLGLGRKLVEECISFGRAAGYRKITLWTNDILHAARHIYEQAGFRLVSEERHHSFGKDLTGQHWELTLKRLSYG